MFKYLLIAFIIGYVFRRLLFAPIPGSNSYFEKRYKEYEKKKDKEKGEYTDYEEIK